jgi:perosamine synthetase
VFVNSGTDALRIALLSLKEKYGWRDGDEIAVPALTFVATVNVIIQAGLKPFFVDVGMYDYTINPHNLERKISTSYVPDLRAVMPVHLFGQACDPYIYEIAKKYKLKVIEDSCETILNPTKGDVSCHSTYMAHHVTTGVGGMASTNDIELMILMRSYANHGRNSGYIPGWDGGSKGLSIQLLRQRFCFDRVGYSCRGTEFEAVLGLSQMKDLKKNVEKRRKVFIDMLDALGKFDELSFVGVTNNTCMMFPIVINEKSKLKKYELCLELEKNGIETRDMMPITNQPCYKEFFREDTFSVARDINERGFYIGCHAGMGKKDVEYIQKVFEDYLQKR